MGFSRQECWSGLPLPSLSAQSQSCAISSLPYFPQGLAVKKPPSTQETRIRSLGGKEPLEKEMATHSSTLPGKSHGTWRATVQRIANSWIWLSTSTAHFAISQHLFLFLPDGVSLRRAHHLPGLLPCLPFGVAGIAVLSWDCWNTQSAGAGIGYSSWACTSQPWTSTLTLTGSLSSTHPFALALLSLCVWRSSCGAAAHSRIYCAALSCCPGSQGDRGVWRRTAAGAGRH